MNQVQTQTRKRPNAGGAPKRQKGNKKAKDAKTPPSYPGYHFYGGKYYKNSDGVTRAQLADAFSKVEVEPTP